MGLSGIPAPTWWRAILGRLGAPYNHVTDGNLNAWLACEASGAANNPFNTTLPWPGSTDYLPNGVRNYPDFSAGVAATVATLQGGQYGAIIRALRTSASRAVFAGAVGSSPWGTSGACIGGASGVAPAPGAPGQVLFTQHAGTLITQATREVARAARQLVWQRMDWRAIGRPGWRP